MTSFKIPNRGLRIDRLDRTGGKNWPEWAYKPDPVFARRRTVAIHLGPALLRHSSGLPESSGRATLLPRLPARNRPPIWPCSRRGLPSPRRHRRDWCAFTAPFHLYNAVGRCSLLSVALSIASPLLGVTQHPALRSPDFPRPDCSGRDHLPNSSADMITHPLKDGKGNLKSFRAYLIIQKETFSRFIWAKNRFKMRAIFPESWHICAF